jgi:hypothetical protein
VNLAKVTVVTPLTVQIKGDTSATLAQQKSSAVPTLVIGDDVVVEFLDRRLVVLHKIVAA